MSSSSSSSDNDENEIFDDIDDSQLNDKNDVNILSNNNNNNNNNNQKQVKNLIVQQHNYDEEKNILSSSGTSQPMINKDQQIDQLQNQVQQMMMMLQQQQNEKQMKKQKKQMKKQNLVNSFIPNEPKYNTAMFSPQPNQQPTYTKNNSGTDIKRRPIKMKVTPPPSNFNNNNQNKSSSKKKGKKSSGSSSCLKFFVFLFIFVAIGFFTTIYFDASVAQEITDLFTGIFGSNQPPPKVRVVTQMTDVFPSPECIKVGKRQLSRMRDNMDEWDNLDHSLYHHLTNKRLGAISAFRIGLPYCYTLMRMPGNATLRMLNPEIIAFSIDKVTSPKEKPYNCMDIARWVKRSDDITVIYNDPVRMDKKLLRLTNQTAWAFQHEYIYNHSFDICKGEDRGVDILQDMFFADKQKNLKKLNQ